MSYLQNNNYLFNLNIIIHIKTKKKEVLINSFEKTLFI